MPLIWCSLLIMISVVIFILYSEFLGEYCSLVVQRVIVNSPWFNPELIVLRFFLCVLIVPGYVFLSPPKNGPVDKLTTLFVPRCKRVCEGVWCSVMDFKELIESYIQLLSL